MRRLLTGIGVGALIAAVAGGVGFFERRDGDRRVQEKDVSVVKCSADLAKCSSDLATSASAANEAASTLTESRAELEGLRGEHAETEKRLAAFKALTEKFQKMIDSGKLSVSLRHGRMIVKLPAGILFASGSAELSKEGKDSLRDVAVILRTIQDRQFMVAGHTDSMPIDPKAVPPSPFKNNLELSTARAVTVVEQLITSGMNAARLVAAGYGEHEPAQSNAHEAGRQENRRIEIVLLPNVTELPNDADGGAPDAKDAGSAADAGKPPKKR